MKKKYLTPATDVVQVLTTGMIAVSLFGGELGSRETDFLGDEDISGQLEDDTDWSVFDDGTMSADDFMNL